MKNTEIKSLLDKLALVNPQEWVWKAGYETNLNGSTIDIIGDSEFGFSYYIKINGVEAYHGEPELFLFRSSIDRQLDRICNALYKYNKNAEKNNVANMIKAIIND